MASRYPLPRHQAAIYLAERLGTSPGVYNTGCTFRVDGRLDREAFETACRRLVDRHDVLRAVFSESAGRPIATIRDRVQVDIEWIEAGLGEDAAALDAAYQRVVEACRDHRFSLLSGPVSRVLVQVLSARVAVVCFMVHHIAVDAGSQPVLLNDLLALYESALSGTDHHLGPARQYGSYATSDGAETEDKEVEALCYWSEQLREAAHAATLLPDKRSADPYDTLAGNIGISIPAEHVAALTAQARERRVTPFTFLLACLHVAFYRSTGEPNIPIGTPISLRVPSTRDVIGTFVNGLPLHTPVRAGEAFRDFLTRVNRSVVGALSFRATPNEALIAATNPPRVSVGSPLFRATFVFQHAPETISTENGSLSFHPFPVPVARLASDLAVYAVLSEAAMEIGVAYRTALYHRATIEAFGRRYVRVIEQALQFPDRPIERLAVLSDDERNASIVRAVTHVGPVLDAPRIVEGFARDYPDRVALTNDQGRSVTYAQLDELANAIAATMHERSIGADDRVGIFSEKSFVQIASTLAVLKVNACYCNLDPEFPDHRLHELLADLAPRCVLTSPQNGARLARLQQTADVVVLSEDLLASAPKPVPSPGDGLSRPAYIKYTSGSTGAPKGVVVTQRAMIEMASDALLEGFGPAFVCAHLSPITFDVSVMEIWGSLLRGGAVALPANPRPTLADIASLLTTTGATTLAVTPVVFNELAAAHVDSLAQLKHIYIGGDVPSEDAIVRVWKAGEGRGLDIKVIYGATETTVNATSFSFRRGPRREDAPRFPIGRPFSNTAIYLLDDNLEPVPSGTPGMVYVGGARVALGYHRRPELTAESFLPDPFSPESGSRMYRTGDYGRWTVDGQLEFLGRKDHQVKIRGVRVELEEIEAAIMKSRLVESCAVVTQADRDTTHLVALVVPQSTSPTKPVANLRSHLQDSLPSYLVPRAIISVERLPRTSSGKIDRKAVSDLPAIDDNRAEAGTAMSRQEELVHQVWMTVLDGTGFALDANFFTVGGDSLQAMKVIAALAAQTGTEISMSTFAEAPTIRRLAELLNADSHGSRDLKIPELRRLPADVGLAFASENQRMMWLSCQAADVGTSYNVAFRFDLQGPIEYEALARSIDALFHAHSVLRTSYRNDTGDLRVVVTDAVELVPMYDLSGVNEERAELALQTRERKLLETRFVLDAAAPIAAELFKLSNDRWRLVIAAHHIALDEASVRILGRDLVAYYDSFVGATLGEPVSESRLDYLDFAHWQRAALPREVIEEDLAYWRERLDGCSDVRLVATKERGGERSFAGVSVRSHLGASLSLRIRELCKQNAVTPFTFFATTLSITLSRLVTSADLVIGTAVSGRVRREMQDIVGMFANVLPLRFTVDDEGTFLDNLRTAAATVRKCFEHQFVAFDRLVGELHVPRAPRTTSLFQVLMILTDDYPPVVGSSGVQCETSGVPTHEAKFDLIASIFSERENFHVDFVYNTGVFHPEYVEAWLQAYVTVCEQAVAQPATKVEEYTCLSAQTLGALLSHAENASVPGVAEETLCGLFAEAVRRAPEALAVIDGSERYTYAAIDALTDGVAAALRSQGVGPDELLPALVPRSVGYAMAFIGALKAGCCVCPLDPNDPTRRIASVLSELRARIVLTTREFRHALPANVSPILMDELAVPPGGVRASTDTATRARPLEAPAYVVLTSGSTGAPKAAAVTHRGLLRLVGGRAAIRWRPVDKVGFSGAPTFDIAVFQVATTLLSGACLRVLRQEEILSAETIRALVDSNELSVLVATPTLLSMLLRADENVFANLHQLWTMGEPADVITLRSMRSAHPTVRIFNGYGPSETGILATIHEIESVPADATSIPIGRSCAGTNVYVLDDELRLLPLGAVGNLYVGGPAVGPGYVHRPALTAERFIPNPFWDGVDAACSRLYDTGDRGRMLFDGSFEYLGRRDDQLKVRGHRVEPGEIEAALREHKSVLACRVQAVPNGDGSRLVAYYVAARESAPSEASLRNHVRFLLPAYMIPDAFVRLDELPINARGKVDRAVLAALQTDEIHVEPVQARTPVQSVERASQVRAELHGLFKKALNTPDVDADANFFDAGGNSMLAVQLTEEITRVFSIRFRIVDFFRTPTLNGLAERIMKSSEGAEQW